MKAEIENILVLVLHYGAVCELVAEATIDGDMTSVLALTKERDKVYDSIKALVVKEL